jgi:hypothetical protein
MPAEQRTLTSGVLRSRNGASRGFGDCGPTANSRLCRLQQTRPNHSKATKIVCAADPYISLHTRVLVNAGPSADDVAKQGRRRRRPSWRDPDHS